MDTLSELCNTAKKLPQLRDASRAVADIVEGASEYFDKVLVTYAIHTKELTEVSVGGYVGQSKTIPISRFMEQLGPMFSPLTAWKFMKRHRRYNGEIRMDHFVSKHTRAWDNVIKKGPKVYLHGDEVDPYINLADLIAFHLDRLLYDSHFQLFPDKIKDVWNYSEIQPDFINLDREQALVAWYSDHHIDLTPYIQHPVIFIMTSNEVKEYTLQVGGIYSYIIQYVQINGGCVKYYDKDQDAALMSDGDTIIYVGDEYKKVAEDLATIWDLNVMSILEMRKLL